MQQNKGYLRIYLWILSFLKPYYKRFVLIILISVLVISIELSIPKFIQHFIDNIFPQGNYQAFGLIIILLLGLTIIKIIFDTYKNKIERYLQEIVSRDIQLFLFLHLRHLGFSYFETTPIGEILSLMNKEVSAVQTVYKKYIPWLIKSLIYSIISICLMVLTSPWLSLIIAPSFLLYYLIGPYFEKKATVYGREMAENGIMYNRVVYESIVCLPEIQATSKKNWNINRVLFKQNKYNNSMVKTYFYQFIRGTIRRLSYYVGAMLLLILGAYLIQKDIITVGEFVAFLLYYFSTMQQITSVVTNFTEQKLLLYQVEKLHDFINIKPDVLERKNCVCLNEFKGNILFNKISFSYKDKSPVVRNFSLEIEEGEKIGIVGLSGKGKSTILKLIGRFYDVNEGEVKIDGRDVRDLSFDYLRNNIGYVFQEVFLFGTSIKENIRFGNPDVTDQQIIEASKIACAHDFITNLTEGYETIVGERGIKLSGGEKQRIAIARMVLKKPKIVLLDEATSSLDTIIEKQVQKNLNVFLQNRTTIAIAHRLSTLKSFDKIIVLENGNVAEMGTYEKLVMNKGKFYSLLNEQERKSEG